MSGPGTPAWRLLPVALAALLLACTAGAPPAAPADGEVKSFDGLLLRYTAAGAGDPPLVFIHGWSCNRGQFQAQMEHFAGTHRVYALDLGGHGESGRLRGAWNLDVMARDLAAFLARMDLEGTVIVGHSMGGPVALLAAAAEPGRVQLVVGIDTLHDVERSISRELAESWGTPLEADLDAAAEGVVRGAFTAGATDPALVERLVRETRANDPRVLAGIVRSYPAFDAAAALAACPAPVVCVNAAAPTPTRLEVNRRHDPDFEVVLMEGVSHFPMLERPDEFNSVLEGILERHVAGR